MSRVFVDGSIRRVRLSLVPAYFVAGLTFAGGDVGNGVQIAAGTGDLDFTDFQAGPVNIQFALDGRQRYADRVRDDYIAGGEIDRRNPA